MTPVLATDEMLWAYLCHVEYFDYIKSRWPIKSNDTTTIKSRYFFDGGRARGAARNGLSRLWWASFMTYDGTRENSYEFTKLLLNNQDEFESIIDRSLTRSKNVLFALLTVLSETEHKREDFRALMRRLNRIGGVTMLSILSIDELKGIISKYLNEIIQENNKATTEENVATKQNINIFRRFVSPLKGQKTTV